MTKEDMKTALQSIPAWARIAGGVAAAIAALMAGIASLPAWDSIGITSLTTLESRIKPLHDSVSEIRRQGVLQGIDAKETRRVVLGKIRFDLDLMIRQTPNLPLATRLQLEQQLRDTETELTRVEGDLTVLRGIREHAPGR